MEANLLKRFFPAMMYSCTLLSIMLEECNYLFHCLLIFKFQDLRAHEAAISAIDLLLEYLFTLYQYMYSYVYILH